MSEFNLRDKSRSFWKALEQINKLSVQERLDLTQLLTTCDYNNPNSKTIYRNEVKPCLEDKIGEKE